MSGHLEASSGSPSPSRDIDHILSFGYDDPAFINDVHALIGPNKVYKTDFDGRVHALQQTRQEEVSNG